MYKYSKITGSYNCLLVGDEGLLPGSRLRERLSLYCRSPGPSEQLKVQGSRYDDDQDT
jgi:hypothetical protein